MVNGLADRDRVWEIDHLKSNSNQTAIETARFNQTRNRSNPAIETPNQIEQLKGKIRIEKRVLIVGDEKENPEFCRRLNQFQLLNRIESVIKPKKEVMGVEKSAKRVKAKGVETEK